MSIFFSFFCTGRVESRSVCTGRVECRSVCTGRVESRSVCTGRVESQLFVEVGSMLIRLKRGG